MALPKENEIIDTGEHTLEDLLDQREDDEDERGDDDWEILRELFSSKKEKKRGKTTRGSGVKIASVVRNLEFSDRKKKKKR